MSSISINLLPDARLKRLKQHKQRQTSISVMVALVAVCGGLLLAGFLIVSAQALQISNLTSSIGTLAGDIKKTDHAQDIVSTQDHLDALGELYNRRVYLSTLFNALSQTSPKELSLETLSLSADNSIQLTGQASSYLVASKFARALETRGTQQTDFNAVSADAAKDADFTDVDLSGLSTQTNNRVSFTIKATASTRVINVKN